MRTFWRKKRTIILAVAATIACIAALISTPVRKAMAPPLTMDMGPLEVVEAYYSCFESMDQELMSDCIHKEAGKPDTTEVMNFFVITRVRQGYEGKSGLLSAAEWTAQGRPMPEAGVSVFGLTDVKITTLGENRFQVVYEKWRPGVPEDDEIAGSAKPLYPLGYRVSDTLLLEQQKRGNWLIVKLERTVKDL